jgi:hypothetical protein
MGPLLLVRRVKLGLSKKSVYGPFHDDAKLTDFVEKVRDLRGGEEPLMGFFNCIHPLCTVAKSSLYSITRMLSA